MLLPQEMSLAELRKYFLQKERIPSRRLLSRLEFDPRQGAQRIAKQVRRRRRALDRERHRMRQMLKLEEIFWAQGLERVAGVDEVGVGPLAGPVVAAAVIFLPGSRISGLKDSKQLDQKQREEFAREIRRQANCIAVGKASVEEVDALNPYHAALLAMCRAVEGLDSMPQQLLVDARTIPGIDIPQEAIIKGDRKHFSIAAASIIAKQWRDQLMCDLAEHFPGYGFARHKGYSTPEHQVAIRRLGPCRLHRSSYSLVQELAGNCSASFYRLKTLLDGLETRDDLVDLRRELLRSTDLTQPETQKLRVLIQRRARKLPQPAQMSFL